MTDEYYLANKRAPFPAAALFGAKVCTQVLLLWDGHRLPHRHNRIVYVYGLPSLGWLGQLCVATCPRNFLRLDKREYKMENVMW